METKVSTESEMDGAKPWDNPRLSRDVLPEKYKLVVYPKIKEGLFEGQVLIDIIVKKSTNILLIHQTNLTIDQTKLSIKSELPKEIVLSKSWAYPQNHYWVIEPMETLEPGQYELFLTFRGTLSSGTLGFYKTTYKNASDEECSCALSYFEATYARCAFPCFDEPSFRAIFSIRISYNSSDNYVALSNMCQQKVTEDYPAVGITTVQFMPTPLIPPYLVALIVGNFSYTEPIFTKGNVSVAVYSRPEIVQHMKRAQALAVQILDFFANYFDIPFVLPKLDLIALPDSNIGGMENWGMITFKESCLLLNDNSTCDDLYCVTSIIAHEISHMWFGDLVTISWWDNLWLKEGFATFMSCIAGGEVFPEWYNDWTKIMLSLSALQMDAPLDSHPLVQSVSTPAEIREVFDAVSYDKGCCLINMLRDIDPRGFQEGIQNYLKRYKYESTVTQNLWDELQKTVKFNVTEFMDTWSLQMGFPVLEVKYCTATKITVSQSRFLLNKNLSFNPETSPFRYKWKVPIKYITSAHLKAPKLIWLDKDLESVSLETDKRSGWVKLNWHQVGFYRVNYSPELWQIFSIQLIRNHMVLDVEDRANLLDDAFSLACSGYFYYNIPLNLVKYFKFGNESHFFPWRVAAQYLQYIKERLTGTEGFQYFQKFIHSLLKPNISDEIWEFHENVTFLQKKLKLQLIKLGCSFEEPSILEKIKTMLTDWLNGVTPHPELLPIVFSYGLSSDISEEVWTKVLNYTLKEATDVKERLSLWQGLTCVRNKDYLKNLIELAKDERNLKSQDFFGVLTCLTSHQLGHEVLWDFIRDEWEYLVDRFTLEDPSFSRCLHRCCSIFSTEDRLKETKDFFEKYPDAGCSVRSRKMALENIKVNIEWNARNIQSILECLKTSDSDDWYDKKLESFILK